MFPDLVLAVVGVLETGTLWLWPKLQNSNTERNHMKIDKGVLIPAKDHTIDPSDGFVEFELEESKVGINPDFPINIVVVSRSNGVDEWTAILEHDVKQHITAYGIDSAIVGLLKVLGYIAVTKVG